MCDGLPASAGVLATECCSGMPASAYRPAHILPSHSGLLPLEAPVMIAEKRKLFFSFLFFLAVTCDMMLPVSLLSSPEQRYTLFV